MDILKYVILVIALMLIFVGCGSDSPMDYYKSCEENTREAYSNGCTYSSTGKMISLNDSIRYCRELASWIGAKCPKCEDELTDYIGCVPNPIQNCDNCKSKLDSVNGCCSLYGG